MYFLSLVTSLTIPRPTNAAGVPVEFGQELTQEQFFRVLEKEMRKIERFTQTQVQGIRKVLNEVERTVTFAGVTNQSIDIASLTKQVEEAGKEFLK